MADINKELYDIHFGFFREFFKEDQQLDSFIREKLDYAGDNTIRRMLNNVQRLCTLSDEMEQIRPGRRDLSIFFVLTCIESLYSLSLGQTLQKQQMVIDFYRDHITSDDQKLIESKIKVLRLERQACSIGNISMEQFALLLLSIRNNVAHEGVYWSFHFKGESEGTSNVLNILNSKLKKDQGYQEITYEVGLKYSEFREITVKGFINFLNKHFSSISGE